MTIWAAIRFLHVLAAVLWVGGQLTLSLIVRPASVELLDADTHRRLLAELGRRYARIAAAGLIPVLIATGLALAYHRGVTVAALTRPGYGMRLGAKIVLALVSFALAGAHGVTALRSSARAIRIAGISGGVISVAVVALAVSLVP